MTLKEAEAATAQAKAALARAEAQLQDFYHRNGLMVQTGRFQLTPAFRGESVTAREDNQLDGQLVWLVRRRDEVAAVLDRACTELTAAKSEHQERVK